MGYHMFLLHSDIFISQEKHDSALATIKSAMAAEGKREEFAFVSKQSCLLVETFVDVMRIWRWLPECDDDGNIVSLDFLGEKLGNEDFLFGVIAPFVKDGSNVQMAGEDGRVWQWLFHSGIVDVEEGVITFQQSHSAST